MHIIDRLTTFWQNLSPNTKRLIYYGCVGMIILSPLITVWGMSLVLFDATPLEFVPLPSDEVLYWHQTATFKTVGFEGGYYSIEESPAPLSFIHFYTHGPVYPVVLGLLGRVFGWHLYAQPLFNIAFMMLALVIFIAVTRPDFSQLFLLVLTLYTFWPALTYMLTGMRTSPQIALAIILAALFYVLIVRAEQASVVLIVSTGLLILFMALIKPTWSLLYLPYFLLIRDRLTASWVVATLIAGACITACFVGGYFLAAHAAEFVGVLDIIRTESLVAGIIAIGIMIWENLRNFVDPSHKHVWLLLRGQMVLLIGLGLWAWWKGDDQQKRRDGMVVALNLGLVAGIAIVLYDIYDWRDYRLFVPHTALAMFILVARRRRTLLVILIASNMVVAPSALKSFQNRNYFSFGPEVAARIADFEQDVGAVLVYDEQPNNAWCNTLLIPFEVLVSRQADILGTPPGIGLSWSGYMSTAAGFRSRYVLLADGVYEQIGDRIPLEYQASTAIGDIYINQAVECP
ncbi:hypothetical protein ACFLYO_07770 [Chloroflexota bacterium]